MGIKDKHDERRFEHLAKVNADGVVLAMVEVWEGADLFDHKTGELTWTDEEGHRYVYLTDLQPLDIHGLQLLPAING